MIYFNRPFFSLLVLFVVTLVKTSDANPVQMLRGLQEPSLSSASPSPSFPPSPSPSPSSPCPWRPGLVRRIGVDRDPTVINPSAQMITMEENSHNLRWSKGDVYVVQMQWVLKDGKDCSFQVVSNINENLQWIVENERIVLAESTQATIENSYFTFNVVQDYNMKSAYAGDFRQIQIVHNEKTYEGCIKEYREHDDIFGLVSSESVEAMQETYTPRPSCYNKFLVFAIGSGDSLRVRSSDHVFSLEECSWIEEWGEEEEEFWFGQGNNRQTTLYHRASDIGGSPMWGLSLIGDDVAHSRFILKSAGNCSLQLVYSFAPDDTGYLTDNGYGADFLRNPNTVEAEATKFQMTDLTVTGYEGSDKAYKIFTFKLRQNNHRYQVCYDSDISIDAPDIERVQPKLFHMVNSEVYPGCSETLTLVREV